jgi:hypothetical protein
MFRHGRATKRAKEVSAFFREMRKDADVMTAAVMSRHGLKPLRAIRRKSHVRRALRAAKKAKEEGEKA